MNKKVSILGCGWLGLPLAKHLLGLGYEVKGSSTTESKLDLIKREGIEPYLINIDHTLHHDLTQFLDTDTIVINIPPRRRSSNVDQYSSKIEKLIPHIKKSRISKVIFVSSTSVYAAQAQAITETIQATPKTDSGIALLATERLLQDKIPATTILRLSGLIGPLRHPGKFLSGKTELKNPWAPVNLIHLDDCIGIISTIIKNQIAGEVFNACSNEHPSRSDFYREAAMQLGLTPPEFDNHQTSVFKLIDNKKITERLKYTFKRRIDDWHSFA